MTSIKQFFVLVVALLLYQSAFGADEKFSFEPLYGIETSLVRYPDPPRYVTRATYGARFTYGAPLLAGELELTEAKSREDYNAPERTTVEDTSQRAGLGLRSSIPLLAPYLGFFFRAGGRASKGETKITTAAGTETKPNPLRIDPYAGTGLNFSFGSFISINAGATLIRNFEGKYDAQYLLGLSAHFGNR